MDNNPKALTRYRQLPDSADKRAYIVASTMLRLIDLAGLHPTATGVYVIQAIDVYRRRIAVYTIADLPARHACMLIDRIVPTIGINMLVMPPANGSIRIVADLYSRDNIDYYQRL